MMDGMDLTLASRDDVMITINHEEHMNSLSPERREAVETRAERLIQIAEAISKLEWLFEADRYPSYKEEWEIVKEAAWMYSELCD